MKKSINPLVIYHANCADGFGAAWVFHHMQDKLEQSFDFHAGVYGVPPPDCTDRVVYLVDFSYKRDVVKEICAVAKRVILIDHHKTAIEDLKNLYYEHPNFLTYTDLERSGAMLAWDYWHNTTHTRLGAVVTEFTPRSDNYMAPPPLLAHIQDRDLWKFNLPCTREISASLFSYEYSFEDWDFLMATDALALDIMIKEGAAIERKHHKDIAELVKVTQRIMTIGDYDVPVASLPYTYSSDAGHLMAANYRDGKVFAACYWDTIDKRQFSLRSTSEGLDVSAIASSYGGGGHRNAAGFSVPRDHALARF